MGGTDARYGNSKEVIIELVKLSRMTDGSPEKIVTTNVTKLVLK